jgi:hypothetical protein
MGKSGNPAKQEEKQEDFQPLFTKEQLDYLQTLKIFIGTPAYGGMTSSFYTQSIAQLFKIAGAYGIEVGIETIANESLITRARNSIVADFLDTDYTHLFFIDADIQFSPIDVFRLILHKKDVVSGAYPMKGINWPNTIGATTPEEASERSTSYVINFHPDAIKEKTEEGDFKVSLVGGLLAVYDTGTGFLCINRAAIEKLIETYGEEILYKGDSQTVEKDETIVKKEKTFYALFDTSIDLETERYLSEDYTFCRRWQSLGENIWVDPEVVLNHIGMNIYRGYNFLKPAQS